MFYWLWLTVKELRRRADDCDSRASTLEGHGLLVSSKAYRELATLYREFANKKEGLGMTAEEYRQKADWWDEKAEAYKHLRADSSYQQCRDMAIICRERAEELERGQQ